MWLSRTELLLGNEKLEKLKQSSVLVAGLGGVGAYAAEMLCRAGVGKMTLIDGDTVSESNLNRQLPALQSNIGISKSLIMEKRLSDINPELRLTSLNLFLQEENIIRLLNENDYDFVIDAIDTIAPKVALIKTCIDRQIPIISSMGAGGRLDPGKITISDIWKTYHCALAKTIRTQLKQLHIREKLPVVFSTEQIDRSSVILVNEQNKKSTLGTISYIPAIFGCYLASYVIRKLVNKL